jgi:two-component system phosphate regulon response regulator PhoB
MRPMPSVLIVEDEAAIAELITVNLRHHGFRPIWAAEGVSAQRELDSALPSLILLDWMLPGESGLALAQRWRQHPRLKLIPLIMLTARGDEAERIAGLDAGADDYITKPFSVKELLARVRAVLRRQAPDAEQGVRTLGALSLDEATYKVSFQAQTLKLGPTEFKLLQHLMHQAERVHSRAQLLDQVWGHHASIEERTVDVHIKRLREALGAASAMVETVRGVGYRLTAQPTSLAPAPTQVTHARGLNAAWPTRQGA